jgi:hypothetical protein
MSAASVADLVESLRKSRLLDAARMEKVARAQDRFPDALTLARELVKRGWLTREQAQQLLQGPPAAPAPAPVATTNGGTVPAEPRRRRRGAWLLALLLLLLLVGGAGLAVWRPWQGSDSHAGPGRSTEPFKGSTSGGCSDTSDPAEMKYFDDLEFSPTVRAKFDPKYLDALKAEQIPEVEVYPWQPRDLVAILGEHRMRNTLTAANPDGTLVAVAGNQDGFVRIGPIETLHEKVVLGGYAATHALAWSPKGDVLAVAGHDGLVRLWDVRDLDKVPEPVVLEKGAAVTSLSFSHDGKYLIGGGPTGPEAPGRGLLWVWDAQKRQVLHKKPQSAPVTCVAFSPAAGDYRALWGGGPGDGQLYLWDAEAGKELAAVDSRFDKVDDRSYVTRVALSPDGKRGVSGHYIWDPRVGRGEFSVRVWELDRFEKDKEKRVYKGFINDPQVAFAPDGKTVGPAGPTPAPSRCGMWKWRATPGRGRWPRRAASMR